MEAWSPVRLMPFAIVLVVSLPSPAWPAPLPTEPLPQSQPTMRQSAATQPAEFDLEAFIAGLNPPTVEEIIESLQPIPTLEECLAPLPDDPQAPWRRVLTGDDKVRAEELEKRITGLREEAKYADAIPLAEEILAIRRPVQGTDHWETADRERLLATLKLITTLPSDAQAELAEADKADPQVEGFYSRGQYSEAFALVSGQLAVRERLLGDAHPDTLESLIDLAELLRARGELPKAGPLMRQALETCRHTLGDEHPLLTLALMNNMAALLQDQGRLSDAEALYRRALQAFRHVVGQDHTNTLVSINNLGRVLHDQGKLPQAELLYLEAWETSQRLLGHDDYHTLTLLNNLAGLLDAQGRLSEAEPLYREALESSRRTLGDEHPLTLAALNNVAELWRAQGNLYEAEPLYRELLAMRRELLGDNHPHTLTAMNNMAALLHDQGNLSEAEALYRQALETTRQVLGDKHADTIGAMNNLALLLQDQGRLSEAEALYQKALKTSRPLLGDEHACTLTLVGNLATLFHDQGRLAEAEPLYEQTLEIQRRVLGEEHRDTLRSMNNLAVLLQHQGRSSEAEQVCREALRTFRRVLGNQHPSVATCLNNLADVLRDKGAYQASEPLYRESLAIAEKHRTQVIGHERARARYAGKLRLASTAAYLTETLVRLQRPHDAFEVAERGRGRALLDLLARSDRDVATEARRRGGEPLAAELDRLQEAEHTGRVGVSTAEAALAATRKRTDLGNERERIIEEQMDKLKQARRKLRDAEAAVLAKLHEVWPDAKPATTEQVRAALEPAELLLSYTWTPDAVTLLLVPPSGDPTAQVEGVIVADGKETVTQLREFVAEVRGTIDRRPSSSAQAAGAPLRRWELFHRLVPPQVRDRVLPARRVMVVADGPLRTIPFEALAVRPEGDYWLEDGPEVVYAESGTVYMNRRAERMSKVRAVVEKEAVSAVLLGNPVFDRARPEPNYPEKGVYVAMVQEGSNAASAGLQRGDVILGYAGKEVADLEALVAELGEVSKQVKAGQRDGEQRVAVAYWRDDGVHETTLAPGKMGVQLSRGSPAAGLELAAMLSRGDDEAVAEVMNTDYVRLHGKTLIPLPGTEREAHAIATTIQRAGGSAVTLLHENATIAELEAAVEGKRFVHIATHGLTGSVERPYDASLALTQPETPTPEDIGFLTLDHLIKTWRGKLSGCELVVLSACDTQRGVKVGDSAMALPWGFFYAGVPTVVATLWKVDDTATALLMARFYESLLGTFDEPRELPGKVYTSGTAMPKAEALREAKYWLRGLTTEQARTFCDTFELALPSTLARGEPGTMKPVARPEHPFEHPYYWSTFILIGDPN